jgi:cobalt/nickel transport system permease protein
VGPARPRRIGRIAVSAPAALAGLPAAPWLAGRDPRLRVLGALAFAAVTLSLTRPPALLLALAGALGLALGGGLASAALARRLLALEGLMLVLLVTLPFTVPGEVVWYWGTLAASREGLALALAILLKASAITLTVAALVGTMESVVLGHALARLGVPKRLVHLFLFTLRHIHALYGEYARLRQAMRARAFTPRSDRHTWDSLGWLVGMLLVRSLERSRRTMAAMRCRGFHGRFYLLDDLSWSASDSLLAAGVALSLATLLAVEYLV